MIIRSSDNELHFITQPDHAHLSRRIMEHCVALGEHPRAASILLAIGEHDNGWAEADAAPTLDPDTGEPLDFIHAPAQVRQGVWPRGVARLAADPWSAALVAHHAVSVYDRHRTDPAWATFFPQMEAMRDDILRASGGRLDDLLADYRFVRLGDLISLVFCTGWSDQQRIAEWTVHRSGSGVLVTPEPFGGSTVPMEIIARVIPRTAYRSDAALQERLREAPTKVLRASLRG